MSNELMVWKIELGSEAASRLDEIIKKRRKANAARKAFMKEIGAKNLFGTDTYVSGAEFDSPPAGDAWRVERGTHGVYVPAKRTKAGKALAARLRELGAPGNQTLSHDLLGTGLAMNGMRVMSAGVETIGDIKLLVAGVSKDWKPINGLTRLKLSEYHALKEEHEAANAA